MLRRQFLNALGITLGTGLLARSRISEATSGFDIVHNPIQPVTGLLYEICFP
ncbi:hypothetical protein [Paraglaciecola psychrophila]|uniref:hypothetical protein n=1 Tax=Paraglaciecola psychrophila TaxID=326544 RepID=UPI000AA02221|nr:hypothetical protein [Paraglaciecola psychrophila]